MGLDMYLTAKKYLSSHTTDERDQERLAKIREMFPELMTESSKERGIEIETMAIYWRKANHIHNWFVENVQGGEDDCRKYDVCRDQLEALRDACESALDDKENAGDYLPTVNGFFFGGTEYDKWYFQDCEDTIKAIDECLKMEGVYFSYQASW